jgi:hypothetical protein
MVQSIILRSWVLCIISMHYFILVKYYYVLFGLHRPCILTITLHVSLVRVLSEVPLKSCVSFYFLYQSIHALYTRTFCLNAVLN